MKKRLIVHGIDIGGEELDEWSPANEIDFECEITIEIGLDGIDGSMLFYLFVISAERVRSIEINKFLKRGLMIKKYDPEFIVDFIKTTVNLNSFLNWEDAKEYLDYYFSNEYFNYNNKHYYLK